MNFYITFPNTVFLINLGDISIDYVSMWRQYVYSINTNTSYTVVTTANNIDSYCMIAIGY